MCKGNVNKKESKLLHFLPEQLSYMPKKKQKVFEVNEKSLFL